MRIALYYFVVYFDILFKKKIIIYIFFRIFISSVFNLIKMNSSLNSLNFIVNLFKRERMFLSFFYDIIIKIYYLNFSLFTILFIDFKYR